MKVDQIVVDMNAAEDEKFRHAVAIKVPVCLVIGLAPESAWLWRLGLLFDTLIQSAAPRKSVEGGPES